MTEITGVKEVVAALGKLPGSTRKKALRAAMKKSLEPVRDQAISNLLALESSEATGLLARSVVIKNIKAKRGELRVSLSISGKKLSKRGARVGLYGSVFEFGKEHQPPRPWLRPAIAQKSQAAIDMLGQEFAKGLDAAVLDAKK